MFCSKCGLQIQDGVRFCPRCGAVANTQADRSPDDFSSYMPQDEANRAYCASCGKELGQGERFCQHCGTAVKSGIAAQADRKASETFHICEACGTPIKSGLKVCLHCGKYVGSDKKMPSFLLFLLQPRKCVPAFVLGLIASVFGIFGGICMTACASLYGLGEIAFVYILGGSVVGLIGACQCGGKAARVGSVFEVLGALMLVAGLGIAGGDFASIIATIMFFVAGGVGMAMSFRKEQ